MRTVIIAALLCLLIGLSQAQTEFVYTFDNIRREKSYNLGWINNGTTVKITFSTQGVTPVILDFALLRATSAANFLETDSQTITGAIPAQGTDVVCTEDPTYVAGELKMVRICPIIRSDYYRINIDTTTEIPTTTTNPQALQTGTDGQ